MFTSKQEISRSHRPGTIFGGQFRAGESRAEVSELRNRFVCFAFWVMWFVVYVNGERLLLVLALNEGVLDLFAAVDRRDQN
jgi:hypothetical protein